MSKEAVYLLDEEQFARLGQISKALHGGTDRERDYGHKLWLVLNEVRDYGEVPVEQVQVPTK